MQGHPTFAIALGSRADIASALAPGSVMEGGRRPVASSPALAESP